MSLNVEISDPQPALQAHEASERMSKRNKILAAVGFGVLILGGVGAALAFTVFKSKSSSESGAYVDPNNNAGAAGENSHPNGADNADGYSRGYIMPSNANEIIAAMQPYTPGAPLVEALPGTVDWRNTPAVVNPIRNQGGCGACWAFVAIDNVMAAYGMKYGKALVLSPQQLVDCDLKDGGCGGGWPTTAWTSYFKPNNHAWALLESQYPYVFSNPAGKTRNTCTANEALGSVMVTASTNVVFSSTWTQANEDYVMAYIAQNGPVSIAVNSDGWGYYKGGIATTASLGCGGGVNHAVMIVGFGTENGQNYWIVRNQWGASWGENGYIRLARGAQTCCVICYVMAVGVATTITTPTQPVTNLGATLNNNVGMLVGQYLTSPDGTRVFKLQTDGNAVLLKSGVNIWSTNTKGTMQQLKMQTDCNLVLYYSDGTKAWTSNTAQSNSQCSQAYLAISNNGNLAVMLGTTAIWQSNTADVPTTQPPTPTTKPPVVPTTKAPVTSISVVSLGCWGDGWTRALKTKLSVSSDSTMSDCAWLAYNSKLTHYGLQNGGECWGGDGTTYQMYGASTGCNKVCVGNLNEICGGTWAFSGYQIITRGSDPSAFELQQPPSSLDLPGQCQYYKGSKSFCWRCINNVSKTIACQDVTSTSSNPDSKNLFVASEICPDLAANSLTADTICDSN